MAIVASAHPVRRSHGGSTSIIFSFFFQWKNPEDDEERKSKR